MRFVILVAGAAATGALSVSAVQTMSPQMAPTFQAVRAFAGGLRDFKLIEFNPLNKAYEEVVRQITSGNPRPISFPTPPTFNITPINPNSFRPSFKLDDREIQRAVAAGINSRIQQDIRRAQDLAAYGRNPMGWHGPPPH
jgi:hypothetical protein